MRVNITGIIVEGEVRMRFNLEKGVRARFEGSVRGFGQPASLSLDVNSNGRISLNFTGMHFSAGVL